MKTPNDDPAFIYQDTLVAIDVARGINIGEPSLHARCLDALALHEGDTVLQVGAGVGYYSAVLAELVGPAGKVHAYEIDRGDRVSTCLPCVTNITPAGTTSGRFNGNSEN